MIRFLALPLLLLFSAAPAVAQAPPAEGAAPVRGPGIAKEGDIVTVKGQEFRLFGIDAPDPGQKCQNVRGVEYDCFDVSRRILEKLINNGEIECTPRKESVPEGPKLAVCTASGDDLSRVMVEWGWALAYRALSGDYVASEARAASYRRGMWAGRVEAPWLWRSRQQAEQQRQPR